MIFGLAGAAFTALCCFTPILAGLLGVLGLGAAMGYLDYVLLPALAGFLGLAVYGLFGRNREEGCICGNGKEQSRIGRM
jgi:hypothetical protein